MCQEKLSGWIRKLFFMKGEMRSMKENMLSMRLKMVAEFLPAGANFADIGSDHAYLPCFVCASDPEARAIAGEITEGPYESAKHTVREMELEDRVSVRKGNGLGVIDPGEVQQVVIAGMGGGLITAILEAGKDKLTETDQLILQPNVDARKVRQWLIENGYRLSMEEILEESGHVYEILFAEKTIERQMLTDKELLFGPWLMRGKGAPFRKKWTRELEKMDKVLMEMQKAKEVDQRKFEQFEKEKNWIKEVINDG